MSRPVDWSDEVGIRPFRVIAEERTDRKGMVYLRWWMSDEKRWKVVSTGLRVRNQDGTLSTRKVASVMSAASDRHAQLTGGREAVAQAAPLTILQGLELALDRHGGKYPKDTPHRKEVEREVRRAAELLGGARTWNSLKPFDLRTLYRRRAEQLAKAGRIGRRGAEITVSRLLAVAEWLRGEGMIDGGACHAPKNWQSELGSGIANSDPKRPRYTLEESRKILAAAPLVDPRLALAYRVGIGQRLGQVIRCMRTSLDLAGPKGTGTIRVPGSGNKRAGVVVLLPVDVAVVREALTTGFLRLLEAGYQAGRVTDYPLFPSGPLRGRRKAVDQATANVDQVAATPCTMTAVRIWFKQAVVLAGLPVVKGLGTYGIKRAAVDFGKKEKLSRDELAKLGGWKDPQMADRVYADEEALEAATGAARARLAMRGEE